jgi:hypothetical protein
MANEPHDNVRMLRLVRDSKIPTVGICMGEIGVPSRILAGKFRGLKPSAPPPRPNDPPATKRCGLAR